MGNFEFCLFLLLGTLLLTGAIPQDDANPYRHRATLDPQGKYQLEWAVDLPNKLITFNVTVQARGYVGFGLSRRGKMSGADIVIGGVDKRGRPYFSDYHAIANQVPVEDESQDWVLNAAWERGQITFLSFSRSLDTCDADHDLPITNDYLAIIWAYADKDDDIHYHGVNRGVFDAYLLDPDLAPRNLETIRQGYPRTNVSVHRITSSITLPPTQDTMYWCRWYKMPFTKKHHIVGLNTNFPDEISRRHVHHLLLHRCRAPPGFDQKEFFTRAERSSGSECYLMDLPNPLPTTYCREVLHVWGVGGNPFFFPNDAGMPLGDEYFMFQVHYDNPELVPDLKISVSLELFYTKQLREHDVGVLQLGGMQPAVPSNLIPPEDQNHLIMGHCAPGCTERMIPPQGVNVFAAFLHTHISGRGIRALHFRGGRELPWILNDDQYNFNYQQNRVLNEQRRILPGDFLMQRCHYDSTNRSGSVVHGGFSTREEMCSVFLYYYQRIPGFSLCRSEVRDRRYFDLIGLGSVEWNQTIRRNLVVSPERYRGMTFVDFANNHIKWDQNTRDTLQYYQLTLPQTSQCPRFYYEDPKEQIEIQLRQGFLERTGQLPGSDGRRYTSVDDDFEHESQLSPHVQRYERPEQCVKKVVDVRHW